MKLILSATCVFLHCTLALGADYIGQLETLYHTQQTQQVSPGHCSLPFPVCRFFQAELTANSRNPIAWISMLTSHACPGKSDQQPILEYRLGLMAGTGAVGCPGEAPGLNIEDVKHYAACYGALPCTKVGVYIGTFDPFHYTHYEEALHAINTFGLDELLIIPNATSESKKNLLGIPERMKIIESYFNATTRQKIRILDLDREDLGGMSKAAYFLKQLSTPNRALFYVMGTDVLDDLPSWKDADLLLRWAHLIVDFRKNASADPASFWAKSPLKAEQRAFPALIAGQSGHGIFFKEFSISYRGSLAIKRKLLNGRLSCEQHQVDLKSAACKKILTLALGDDLSPSAIELILANNWYPNEAIQAILAEVDSKKEK